MLRLACKTLGCKLNQIETENIAGAFVREGFDLVPWGSDADLYLINTCTVTSKAEQKARREIRLALQRNPEALVVITGCYAELDSADLDFGPRAIVIPGSKKNLLAERAAAIAEAGYAGRLLDLSLPGIDLAAVSEASADPNAGSGGTASGGKADPFFFSAPHKLLHTRPFLKIQDGCSRRCAYCRVCLARGAPISLEPDLVLERVMYYEALGAPEIVLTGINLSLYESAGKNFASMLASLLAGTKRIRFRLSSWEPDMVSPEFLELFSEPRIQPFMHLSIQSGSTDILRSMRRLYSREDVVLAVERLRSARGDFFLGADFISGFPGESETDFEQSLSLVSELDIAGLHAFTFSPRPGTSAYTMKPRIPERISVARTEALIAAGKARREGFLARRFGLATEAMIEYTDEEVMSGLTPDYLHVKIEGAGALPQDTALVRGLLEPLPESSSKELFDARLVVARI